MGKSNNLQIVYEQHQWSNRCCQSSGPNDKYGGGCDDRARYSERADQNCWPPEMNLAPRQNESSATSLGQFVWHTGEPAWMWHSLGPIRWFVPHSTPEHDTKPKHQSLVIAASYWMLQPQLSIQVWQILLSSTMTNLDSRDWVELTLIADRAIASFR